MIRALHRWPGLLALCLILVVTLTGAALSVFPMFERAYARQTEAGLTVADLAARVQAAYPGVEQIKRAPSGKITAYWFEAGAPGAAVIDPATGQGIGAADPNRVQRWLTDLHRALMLDDAGRIAVAGAALMMLVLAASGVVLVARRVGGLRRWFAPLRGNASGQLHVEIARVTVLGLGFSAATALWMVASTFGFVPQDSAFLPMPETSGTIGIPLTQMDLLTSTPIENLRAISFPAPDDPSDVVTLNTDQGTGYLDQGTGAMLAWADLGPWERATEMIYALHTGQGASLWLLGLAVVLGISALGAPVLAVTGAIVWLSARRGRVRVRRNVAAARAQTILLVASEGGTTWGFAATLHAALTAAGQRVHTASLASFAPARYTSAQRIVILAATYGDGDAPASAAGALARIAAADCATKIPVAVLGFGDRSFAQYCAFAQRIAAAVGAKGWPALIAFDTINCQSAQDFARWGRVLGAAMGIELALAHVPRLPETHSLTLISRRVYGADLQAPTAILRFALPQAPLWRRLWGAPRFEAGDLLGIVPDFDTVPRLYSLASGRRDGFVEIVLRQHLGGLCSGQLLALPVGGRVTAFIRPNPGFHADHGAARKSGGRSGGRSDPLILIGAGTGIGPLAGFIRSNTMGREIHLVFGLRHKQSDFLYGEELADWKLAGRLSRLVTAVSRGEHPSYVQDQLRAEAVQIARLIRDGARIMVCGGREMALGVSEALAEILAPMNLTPAALKAEGRYAEDVY